MSRIRLEDVSKRYGSVIALADFDLDVSEAEFVTILGPSGSGKTTTLSIIAGLTAPTRGRIRIGDRDVTNFPSAKRNVGLVFQSYALFPHMTVEANVAFGLRVRGVGKHEAGDRVRRALELVRLDGYQQRKPSQLSGGQQQRVALARAFVFEPAMLLLDEPVSALDRKLREEVRVELRQLQRALGITTVLVTHDQEEAMSMSDRLAVLSDGRIQQLGTPEEVYLRPVSRFVADFLGTANIFQGTLRRRTGGTSVVLGDGQVLPCGNAHVPAGTIVSAMLRPERLRLTRAGGIGGINARLVDAIYLGRYVRYHVQLADGTSVVVSSTDVVPMLRPGDEVVLTWDPSDVWILPPEDSTAPVDPSDAEPRPLLATR